MKRVVVMIMMVLVITGVYAQDMFSTNMYPTAIFPFNERGAGVKGYGSKVSDILFAQLVIDPKLILVDREEMNKTLGEQELNISGMVNSAQAVQVGQLTGAKLLITGSVIEADKTIYIVAKIIGTETSRVLGESVKGRTTDELGPLVEQLAEKVSAKISKDANTLVAKVETHKDRVAKLNKVMGDAKRPTVIVSIQERHVGQTTIDPAAETEISLLCKETGFTVLDSAAGTKGADIIIKGEGFSEFAMRRGNLVSVKARLEVKAIDPATDKVIAIDRQVAVEVDLTEQIAGKKALQKAADMIAQRMLPKLVK
ncbi:MAG: curli assembly protein CsgG [Kiritimatiellae bacterium]|jgi:TolB-like protein|nr:curli assembly protein CsgG [Kiritimatiellia bacterium]